MAIEEIFLAIKIKNECEDQEIKEKIIWHQVFLQPNIIEMLQTFSFK